VPEKEYEVMVDHTIRSEQIAKEIIYIMIICIRTRIGITLRMIVQNKRENIIPIARNPHRVRVI